MDVSLAIAWTLYVVAVAGPGGCSSHHQAAHLSLTGWTANSTVVRSGAALQEPSQQEGAAKKKEGATKKKQDKPQQVTVQGRILYRDGKQAARAQVSATGPKGFRTETIADEGGRFQIVGPEGGYVLEVKVGDQQQRFTARIVEGRLEPAEFTLN